MEHIGNDIASQGVLRLYQPPNSEVTPHRDLHRARNVGGDAGWTGAPFAVGDLFAQPVTALTRFSDRS